MVLTPDALFNPSGEIGNWFSSVTNNFTGSVTYTAVIMILCLIILIAIFKMPDILTLIIIFAPVIILSTLSTSLNLFVGILILIAGVFIWSQWFAK